KIYEHSCQRNPRQQIEPELSRPCEYRVHAEFLVSDLNPAQDGKAADDQSLLHLAFTILKAISASDRRAANNHSPALRDAYFPSSQNGSHVENGLISLHTRLRKIELKAPQECSN